jgi:hypothetical protein
LPIASNLSPSGEIHILETGGSFENKRGGSFADPLKYSKLPPISFLRNKRKTGVLKMSSKRERTVNCGYR